MARRSEGSDPVLRADGRWQAVYTDRDGKRRYVYGKTKATCKAELRRRLKLRDAGIIDSKMKVGAWLDTWCAKPRDVDPSTTERDWHDLRLIPDRFRDRPLNEVRASDVDELMAELLKTVSPRTKKPYARSTVARTRRTLGKAFKAALADGLIERDPVALSKPVKDPPREVVPLSDEECMALLSVVKGRREWSLYLTTVTLGLRLSECLNLRWRDVDLEAGTLRVHKQAPRNPQSGIVIEKDAKAGSKRVNQLPEVLVDALRAWRRQAMEHALRHGYGFDESTPVWATRSGGRISHRNMLRNLHRACDKAGIRRIRFHDLRHSAATFLLAMNIDSRRVMAILGHKDPRMMVRYQHVTDDMAREDAQTASEVWKRRLAGG